MSRISLKNYGFGAARLLWRRRAFVLGAALVIGVGLAFAALALTDPANTLLALMVILAPLMAAATVLFVAGVVLKFAAKFDVIAEMQARNIELNQKITELGQKIIELREINTDLRFLIEERTNSLAAEQARRRDQAEHMVRRLDKESASLEQLALRERETIKSVSAMEKAVVELNGSTKNKLQEIDMQFRKTDDRLASKARAEVVDKLGAALSDSNSRLLTISERLQGHHVHDRYLSREDGKRLREEWASPAALSPTDANLNYLASRIRSIENMCSGRLATASQTMIARLLAAQSVNGANLRILEIGVLFGVASACFHRICSEFGKDVHLTLIDPFEGYYDSGEGDIITGVHVSRAVFESNMKSCGVPASDYSIIQGLSNDPKTIKTASMQEYDVLLIDGDHSYDGVKRDFENFRTLVRPGGVILFDDYGVNEWPDIKRYVDETPSADPTLTLLAKGYRTAAFRVN